MYIITQAPAAAQLAVPTAAGTVAFNVIAGEPGAGTQDNLNMPGSNRLNGQSFNVRASGFVTYPAGTYTANTVQVALYASNTASFSVASGNQVASLTAFVAATAALTAAVAVPWEIEYQGIGDGTSKALVGAYQGIQGTSFNAVGTAIATAKTLAPNSITTFNPATEPPVQFAVGLVTGASGSAGVTASMTAFVLEA